MCAACQAATYEGADGRLVDDGLSMLDLVRHAVTTLAHMMQPDDRLALVAFSTSASVVPWRPPPVRVWASQIN